MQTDFESEVPECDIERDALGRVILVRLPADPSASCHTYTYDLAEIDDATEPTEGRQDR